MLDFQKYKHKETVLVVFTCIFSFLVNYLVGSNGVYPVDTFIHYDNGYRVPLGDDPIKDYWIVHGLLIDYLQSFIVRPFDYKYKNYV